MAQGPPARAVQSGGDVSAVRIGGARRDIDRTLKQMVRDHPDLVDIFDGVEAEEDEDVAVGVPDEVHTTLFPRASKFRVASLRCP